MTAPTPARPRTAAASAYWRRKGAQRLVLDLSTRLGYLDDEWLSRLAGLMLAACARRGVRPYSEDDEAAPPPVMGGGAMLAPAFSDRWENGLTRPSAVRA